MVRTTYLIALGAICCSLPAQAEPIPGSRSVSIADLNLADGGDRSILDRRLTQAARAVCGAKSVGDGVGNERIDQCRSQTLAKARQDAEVRIAAGSKTVRLAARGR